MPITTTLSFAGHTEEAIEFYRQAIQAEVLFMMRFREAPDPKLHAKEIGELIFHATFRIEETELMASDIGYAEGKYPQFRGFALAIRIEQHERARSIFDSLAHRGNVVLPLEPAAFTSWYGIVTDPFGVTWKITVP